MLFKVFFSVLVLLCRAIFAKNLSIVCRTLEDYFEENESNSDCWYDRDVNAQPGEVAKNHNLSLERHFVETEDGWTLTIFRLKTFRGYGKGVIFLQHGMLTDAMCFMANGENSIAFFLAKQGYDVWLGNFRGSEFSTHGSLKTNENDFWNFSFHEHAVYDLPACFRYVTRKTLCKILYIGHSMGGTAMAIYLSLNPAEAEKYVQHTVFLQSPNYMRHTKGLLTSSLVRSVYEIFSMLPRLNLNVLMNTHSFERESLIEYCSTSLVDLKSCVELSNLVNGDCKYPISPAKFYTGLLLLRNGAFKVMFHYAQLIHSGEFRMFDYGPWENWKRYNSSIPPSYNLTYLPNGITWVYGATDTLATKEDILETFRRFQKPNWDVYEIPYNHVNALVDNVYVSEAFLRILGEIIKQHIHICRTQDKIVKGPLMDND